MADTRVGSQDDANKGEGALAPPNQSHSGSGDTVGEAALPVEVAAPRLLSVLVAEDEADMRESLSDILERAGHRVVEAENGQVALDLLQEQTFDVLVLDLHMPKVDGVAVLRQIDVPPPVVIIYTAFLYYSLDELPDQLGAKVYRYMQKPVSPLALITAVNQAAAVTD